MGKIIFSSSQISRGGCGACYNPSMLQAFIFDFDGLILDTETPEYLVWQNVYNEHGHELPHEEWARIIGGYGLSDFDAADQDPADGE